MLVSLHRRSGIIATGAGASVFAAFWGPSHDARHGFSLTLQILRRPDVLTEDDAGVVVPCALGVRLGWRRWRNGARTFVWRIVSDAGFIAERLAGGAE